MIKKCLNNGWITYYECSTGWFGTETCNPVYAKPYKSQQNLPPYNKTIVNTDPYALSDDVYVISSSDLPAYWLGKILLSAVYGIASLINECSKVISADDTDTSTNTYCYFCNTPTSDKDTKLYTSTTTVTTDTIITEEWPTLIIEEW